MTSDHRRSESMKEAFKSLEPSRQYEIFTAAMAEFAEYGYSRASTNRIVKLAGMSKGMLYYYFDNKQSIFDDALDFALDHIEHYMLNDITTEKEGFIERCARLSHVKYIYFKTHPEISRFITSVYFSDDLNEVQKERNDNFLENRKRIIFNNIDMERFRDDIDHATAIKLVSWTINGYTQEMEHLIKAGGMEFDQFDAYFEDFDHYLTALRKLYYKEEYQ